MRRLTITIDVAFGKDEPEEINPQGDVYTATERRPSDDMTPPSVGFGRTTWEDV